jgi:hypothetical protein
MCIILEIILTAPVTVSPAEGRFPTLKFIASYLCSFMSQHRLRVFENRVLIIFGQKGDEGDRRLEKTT